MEIITGKQRRPQRIVIYAPEGIGKSTLASQAPKPLFVDLEKGTSTLDVARTSTPSSWTMFVGQLEEIARDPMGYETLVVDTADWAERLCLRHVCAVADKGSIEDFGYGKGFVKAEEEWSRLLDLLTEISARMDVIVLAHAHLRKFEQPDESGSYDRYEMKLSKRMSPSTKEWADVVLFINYETLVVTDENQKKKAQGGRRVIHTTHHVCWDAKNRHELPEKMEFPKEGTWGQFGENFFGAIVDQSTVSADTSTVQTVTTVEPAPRRTTVTPAAAVQEEPKIAKEDRTAFPTALYDLMSANNVTEEEIQKVVAARGYYPESTPVGNYEDEFVSGVLVAAWPQVFGMIQEARKA